MHIRVSSVKSGKKVYRYAQLVISVRRPSDGMPTTKVIHNLGRLTDQEIENWRIALEALRKGKPLVVATSTSASTLPLKPIANLRFLDLTVLLELWNKWTLGSIIEGLIPKGEALVAPADVIAALTLQRCVEPSPKSYAPQWFPRTALPELLHIEPQHFNNTRIHRVLEELDRVGDQLQHQLPQLYENRDGQFVALFLDVTDSWFVGHGASMAQRGKTKEGRFERKINIAMLCNEKGYPIKWEVIEGRRHDSKIMIDLFRQIAALNWVGKTPVVCDRAMGNTASIQKLLALDVHFLTALTRNEFSSYTNSIPYQKLLDFKLSSREMASDQDIAKVARLVELEGAKKIDETLFFWDLGFIENAEADVPSNPALPLSISEAHSHKTVQAMTMGRILRADLDEGRALSLVKAGKNYGLDKSKTSRLFGLTRLADDIQQTVLNGGAQCLSINDLVRVSKIEGEEAQREQFRQMIETIGPRPNGKKARGANPNPASRTTTPRKKLPLRAVLYFNPTMFVLKRLNAQETLDDINNFIKELNASLASPRSRREKESISNLVRQRLAKHRLIDTFELSINEKTIEGRKRYQVELTLDPQRWERRRRYDGFNLLVGHPDIRGSAQELCQLYRDKETVEYDFRVIKSLVKLRPFNHRTDAKIRAHVTLCMLALLLERTLDNRLKAQRSKVTSLRALDILESCRLNLYATEEAEQSAYCITHATKEQRSVLRSLRMQNLVDDSEMTSRIRAR